MPHLNLLRSLVFIAVFLLVNLNSSPGEASTISWNDLVKASGDPTLSDALIVFDGSGDITYELLLDQTQGVITCTAAVGGCSSSQGSTSGPEVADRVYLFTDQNLIELDHVGATELRESSGIAIVASDVFGVATLPLGHGSFLGFSSDTETEIAIGGAFFGEPTTFMLEADGVFDATEYLNSSLRDAGYTAEFASDPIPDAAAAPEPATLALLGIGLAGLGFARRKRKQ